MNPVRTFRSIFQRYLDESHELFPHEASERGLHEFDHRLGDNDERTHRRWEKTVESTLAEVERLPDSAFGGDDWLDRRGFLSMLRTEALFGGTLRRWRNNPQVHCDTAIQAIFGLVVKHTDDLEKIRPAIESRLRKLPDFLAAGAECLKKPVPLWTKLAGKTCEGALTFLEELEKKLPASPARLFADARGAFKSFARAAANKSPGPLDGYSIGRERFEFLIRERLGLPHSLAEAEALGHSLIAQLGAELKREAKKFGGKPASQILERAAAEWTPSGGSLLGEYERVTGEVRARFAEAGLLTLPRGERLKVMLVPEFLRHQFPTAAYTQPGPFEKNQEGIFWVNDLSLLQTEPAKRRAEIAQHFGLDLTCAHEAYPGHHVQFVLQNQHRSKLRRLCHHAIFYEGWTLWCEKMCIEHGIVRSPYARLMQLHDALWRAYRIVIDCGLHSGRLSFKAAARLLVEGVDFTPRRAEGDVNWYTSSPSVPMSYLLGRLELEKLHARMVRPEGWTLRQFNDWVLGFGAIPWSWIWQAQLAPGSRSA